MTGPSSCFIAPLTTDFRKEPDGACIVFMLEYGLNFFFSGARSLSLSGVASFSPTFRPDPPYAWKGLRAGFLACAAAWIGRGEALRLLGAGWKASSST